MTLVLLALWAGATLAPALRSSPAAPSTRTAAAAPAGLGPAADEADARADDPRPNFIVILADDLGWGDLEVYGQHLIRTPRLTRMAAEGAAFRQFYSAAPVCPPAREGLLTGLHTGHTVVRTSGVLPGDTAAEPRYLPRMLAGAGYATGMFGKWGMGSYVLEGNGARATGGAPERLGFAEFVGAMTHRDAHTYTLPPFPLRPYDEPILDRLWTIRGGRTRLAPFEVVPFTEDVYLARAVEFIRRHRGEPFFLYLPWTIPHAELYLPPGDPSWAGYLDSEGASVFPETPWPGDRLFRRPNPKPRATYAAMVTRLDRDVGRLLYVLDRLGLSERTLVVVTSDNGPHAAGGIGDPSFFDSAGGLSGMKWSLAEGGIRVPAIVRWPGTVDAGRVIDEPVALWDLLPTFAELAGAEPPAEVDGISLAPLLGGEPQPPHDAGSPLYWEAFEKFRGQAVRVGRWKALRRRLATASDHVALYDLEADPGETTDLASRPERCQTLRRLVSILNAAHRDPPGGGYSVPRLHLPSCPPGGLRTRE